MLKTLREEFPSVLDTAYSDYKKTTHISEIMSPNVIMVSANTSMMNAARIMGERHIGSLLVEGEDRPAGIVTERDLLTDVIAAGKDPRRLKVSAVMNPRLITIGSHASIREAAKMMIKEKGRLVVMDGRNLFGIVTASDLVKSLPQVPETNVPIANFMTKEVISSTSDEPILDIAKKMGKDRIGSVVITKEEKPWGIFTERDLLSKVIYKGESLDMPVIEFCSSPLVRIGSRKSIHKAAETMAKNHIRRLPVSDNDELLGIITARDLVEAYSL